MRKELIALRDQMVFNHNGNWFPKPSSEYHSCDICFFLDLLQEEIKNLGVWGVFEDGHPCSGQYYRYLKAPCWSTHKFLTQGEAVKYLRNWLGKFEQLVPLDFEGGKIDVCGTVFEVRLLRDDE